VKSKVLAAAKDEEGTAEVDATKTHGHTAPAEDDEALVPDEAAVGATEGAGT
jgi:hypothetical protein